MPAGIRIDRYPIRRVGQFARLLLAAPVEEIAAIQPLEGFRSFLEHDVVDRNGAGEPRDAAVLPPADEWGDRLQAAALSAGRIGAGGRNMETLDRGSGRRLSAGGSHSIGARLTSRRTYG